MRATCIDSSGPAEECLTEGRTYEVSPSPHDEDLLLVVDDSGIQHEWNAGRFRPRSGPA